MDRKKRGHMYCPHIYKSQKVARITNNGYLNFLGEYKKRFYGISPQDMVRYAAKQWNQLSVAEKEHFKNLKPTAALKGTPQFVACESKSEVAGQTAQQSPCQIQSPAARQRKSYRSSSRSQISCRSVKSRTCGKPRWQTKPSVSHLGSAVAYIHFLRKLQRQNPELAPTDLLKTATRLWCRLEESNRHAFERPLWILQIEESM